jgi:SAM-dependent methyltransferase
VTQSETNDDTAMRVDAFARWLTEAHSPAHSRRSATENAAFVLPLLGSGVRLLDAGCGPGSITLGLAHAIAPGEAVGIDTRERSISAARAAAEQAGARNARFEVASVYDLPFESGHFDVVFAHAVLQHLAEPSVALAEFRRVLRPGGLLALADADYGGSVIAPELTGVTQSLALVERLRLDSGGNPRIGRQLGLLVSAAGFDSVHCSATAAYEGSAGACRQTGEFWARYMEAPEFVDRVERAQWAGRDDLFAMAAAWRTWGTTPGAFWTRFWCQVLAIAPG